MGPFTILLVEGSSEMGRFRHFSNDLFGNLHFWKCIGYEGHLLFSGNVQNLMQISRMKREMEKKFVAFRNVQNFMCFAKMQRKME